MRPSELPATYYEFGEYVNRARWLTYFEQLKVLSQTRPSRVLEIGVGPGIVRAVLRDRGVEVTTVDVNPALHPDHVADVRDLPAEVASVGWDWVLCSRVLHHVPLEQVPRVLDALATLDARRLLVTVPREDLSVQVSVRRTAGRARQIRLSGGTRLKGYLRSRGVIKSDPSGVWMLGGRDGMSALDFDQEISRRFSILTRYVLPDDPSHVFYVLARG